MIFKIRNKYIPPELAANLSNPDVQNTLKVSGQYFITYEEIDGKVTPEEIYKGKVFTLEPLADRRVQYVGIGSNGLMKFSVSKVSDVRYLLDGPYASAFIEFRKAEDGSIKKYIELVYKGGNIKNRAIGE